MAMNIHEYRSDVREFWNGPNPATLKWRAVFHAAVSDQHAEARPSTTDLH